MRPTHTIGWREGRKTPMCASTQTQRINLRRGALALACAASLAALPACSLGPVDLDALMGNGTSVAEEIGRAHV